MILIGLVGEAPNDTVAIENLLRPYFDGDVVFVTLINDIHGSQLENQKTKSLLRKEYEFQRPDITIIIRDLDSLITDKKQYNKRKFFFTEFNRIVDRKGIYMLHIFEIEALILADIEILNQIYQCNVPKVEDPMLAIEPKELLKSHSKKYSENHNPPVFSKLRIELLTKNCKYFDIFLKRLNKRIKNIESN